MKIVICKVASSVRMRFSFVVKVMATKMGDICSLEVASGEAEDDLRPDKVRFGETDLTQHVKVIHKENYWPKSIFMEDNCSIWLFPSHWRFFKDSGATFR